jgi:spermidine synthase
VKPWTVIARTRTPDGTELTLTHHVSEYVIQADGHSLMSSRTHGSEDALAQVGCVRAAALERPTVLVGGLGMGFTLRAALDVLPPAAEVVVAELVPAVVDWNRGPLAALAGRPLDDPRVQVDARDVIALLRSHPGRFDAVLLDVDNGPVALASSSNRPLYADAGIAAAHASLAPAGVLAVWSPSEDAPFEKRLRAAGFTVRVEHVRGRLKRRGGRHTIFVASRDTPA